MQPAVAEPDPQTDQQAASFRPLPAGPARVGVIGSGRIAEEHLRFLGSHDDVRLIATCDLSPELANWSASRFSAAGAYTDYREMLQAEALDVVHVLTPPLTHETIISECLAGGAHVISEKPIAPTAQSFHSLWGTAQQHQRLLIEDHNYRFNAPIVRLQQLIRDGIIGDLIESEVTVAMGITKPGGRYSDANVPHSSHQMPCGALHEFMTHLTYLTLLFIPGWSRVAAMWSNHGGGDLFKYDDLDAIISDNHRHARIRFSSSMGPDRFRVAVRGTHGSVETDLFEPYLRISRERGCGPLGPVVDHFMSGFGFLHAGGACFRKKLMQRNSYDGLHVFLDRTYRALRGECDPPVTYGDMDGASRLIDALLAEENRR